MGKYSTSTGEFELNELLNFFTVPDLKDLASIFGYRYKSTTRKAYIVSHLSNLMLKEPELIINGAFCYELEAFQAIIDGKMTVDDALEAGWPHTLNRYGLIYVTSNKNTGEKKLHFEKEMAERLKPLIQPELDHRKNIKADLIEKVVIGCTNIYGFTDLAYILKYLQKIKRKLGIELNEVDLFKILFPMYCQNFKNNDIPPYLSPFAKSIGFYPDDEHIDYSIEPKEYDIDTIIKYGEMPYPTIAIAQTAKLKEKLLKYSNRDAASIDKIINDLWLCKQCDGDYISYISDIFSCHNIDQLNECTQATVDFLNNVPFWRLRGNSSQEIAQIEMQEMRRSGQMPKIVIGPNMRAMGIESFEQIQEMAKRGEDFPVQPSGAYTGRKVGRNDPCPCGSGKKYKHCCGK